MAANAIATAFVTIVPSMKGFEGKLREELGDPMEKAGDEGGKRLGGGLVGAAKSFIGPLVAAFSAFAAVDFFKGSIESASNLAESQNAIAVTFGEAAGSIAKLGEDSATRLGLSTSAFNGIATQFSAFASTIAGSGGEVSKVVDELSTRGADFASVMNLDVNEALSLFQSGLAGETEPLRKYGVDLSAAAVEAYAMSEGIWDGVGTMTEAQKVQARYASLMAQTSKTAGDFANTSDGLANSQRIANAQLENARAVMGDALLPVMAGVTNFMADTFVPVLEGLGNAFKWMGDNGNIVIPVLAGLGAVLLIALAPAIWAAVAATWAFTVALLANPITWIVLAVGLLIAGIVALAMNWDAVVAFISDVWNGFIGWITDGLTAFTAFWDGIWQGIVDFFTTIFNAYVDFVHSVMQGVFDFFVGIGEAISNWWNGLWNGIVEFFTAVFNGYVNTVRTIFNAVFSFFKDVGRNISTWWNGFWNGLVGFFEDVFSGISGFVSGIFTGVANAIIGAINWVIDIINGLIDGINGALEGLSVISGGTINLKVGKLGKLPMLAEGGYVTKPTTAIIGEAGPEVVTPLKDFERMMGLGNGNTGTVNYYAAPNASLDSEQSLFTALQRAKVLAAW